jgi:hypothetical protein
MVGQETPDVLSIPHQMNNKSLGKGREREAIPGRGTV